MRENSWACDGDGDSPPWRENGADGDSDILNVGTLYVGLSKKTTDILFVF